MRTSAWVVMLLWVGGCTGNTISLDTVDDGATSDASGTDEGTATSPPADSGTDDGPIPECVVDLDCGECGWCNQGVCEEGGGCCSAEPDFPGQLRCSPPEECTIDDDCFENEICSQGFCIPGPDTHVIEPPLCKGDVALSVEELALAVPLVRVAVADMGGAWGLDADLGAVELDLVAGPSAPVGLLEGTAGVDLLGAGVGTVAGVLHSQAPDGPPSHAIGRAWAIEDATGAAQSPFVMGQARAAAWAEGVQELWVGSDARVERWDVQRLASVGGFDLDADVRAIAAVDPAADGSTLMAVALGDSTVRLLEPASGAPLAMSPALAGAPVDLLAHGTSILAVHEILGDATDEANRTGIHRLELDGSLVAAPPFGVTGFTSEAAVVDVDGNGVDDVLLANEDGRLDILFMEVGGPSCRVYLPLGAIDDIEAGDVDGDGARDLLVLHAGPTVTAVHGVAP